MTPLTICNRIINGWSRDDLLIQDNGEHISDILAGKFGKGFDIIAFELKRDLVLSGLRRCYRNVLQASAGHNCMEDLEKFGLR